MPQFVLKKTPESRPAMYTSWRASKDIQLLFSMFKVPLMTLIGAPIEKLTNLFSKFEFVVKGNIPLSSANGDEPRQLSCALMPNKSCWGGFKLNFINSNINTQIENHTEQEVYRFRCERIE